jgi:hypothetical protein
MTASLSIMPLSGFGLAATLAGGDGLVERCDAALRHTRCTTLAEGVTYGDHRVANFQLSGVGQTDGGQA